MVDMSDGGGWGFENKYIKTSAKCQGTHLLYSLLVMRTQKVYSGLEFLNF
jgi:hypothetical protein